MNGPPDAEAMGGRLADGNGESAPDDDEVELVLLPELGLDESEVPDGEATGGTVPDGELP